MWVVSADQLVNAIFLLVVTGALATLMWKTSNDARAELKTEIGSLRDEMGSLRTELRTEFKQEIQGLRTEMREEFQAVRAEFKEEMQGLRTDIRDLRADSAIMRSDLTQVALAMGVQRRASGS